MNLKSILIVCAGFMLSGCETFNKNEEPAAETVAGYQGTGAEPPQELLLLLGDAIGDVRFPEGTEIDQKRSIILGAGENTYGKLIGDVRADSQLVVKFFKDNMPNEGWSLISEFQADDTTLTYDKPTRVAVVLIERSSRSTTIRLTVTPRNN
ncbi:hypothetical protein [Kordiimonas aquimaris]|uniref:hypothetical protein n=1 Tax=Kordiimonas aquimaris TaxID=707591 RepID=UPI0021D03C56|nr:hypothetical protein [Kordiimonas aquimaris]